MTDSGFTREHPFMIPGWLADAIRELPEPVEDSMAVWARRGLEEGYVQVYPDLSHPVRSGATPGGIAWRG